MLAQSRFENPKGERWMLVAITLLAAVTFAWPFAASELRVAADVAPVLAVIAAAIIALFALVAVNGSLRTAKMVALLAALTALGMVIRFLGLGFGGVEPVFALFIIAGRVLGARFGFALGALVMLASSVLWGTVGPWLPFQMFAAAWVGAGAGMLPRTRARWSELLLLVGYGAIASYIFGLLLNLWWWPFAAGLNTSISYVPDGGFLENASRFLTYSLVTSTLTWDTVRAVTTTIALIVFARPALAALRRVRGVRRMQPGTPSSSRVPASQAESALRWTDSALR